MRKFLLFVVFALIVISFNCTNEPVTQPPVDNDDNIIYEFKVKANDYLTKPEIVTDTITQEYKYFYTQLDDGKYYRKYDEFWMMRDSVYQFVDSYVNEWQLIETDYDSEYKVVKDGFYGGTEEDPSLIDSYEFKYEWRGTEYDGTIRRVEAICYKSWDIDNDTTSDEFYNENNYYEKYVYTYQGDFADPLLDEKFIWDRDAETPDWKPAETKTYTVDEDGYITKIVIEDRVNGSIEESYYTVDNYGDTTNEIGWISLNGEELYIYKTVDFTYGPSAVDYKMINEMMNFQDSYSEIRYIYESHSGYWDRIGEIYFDDLNGDKKIDFKEATSYIRYVWNTVADNVDRKEFYFNTINDTLDRSRAIVSQEFNLKNSAPNFRKKEMDKNNKNGRASVRQAF